MELIICLLLMQKLVGISLKRQIDTPHKTIDWIYPNVRNVIYIVIVNISYLYKYWPLTIFALCKFTERIIMSFIYHQVINATIECFSSSFLQEEAVWRPVHHVQRHHGMGTWEWPWPQHLFSIPGRVDDRIFENKKVV